MKTYDKYTFFWSGPFSQWAESPFEIEGQKFVTAEQYMMYKKAMLFGDQEIADAIMATSNPKTQKALGRKVKGFSIPTWAAVAKDIVYRGSMAKYTQNHEFMDKLIDTEGTLIVEASPFDTVWGIGLDPAQAQLSTPDQWKGTNWLGIVLTEVRESFANLFDDQYDHDQMTLNHDEI